MRISQSSPEIAEMPKEFSALDRFSIDLLIKEARQRQRRRWSLVAVGLIVVAAVSTITSVQILNSSTAKKAPLTSIKSFESLMKHGSLERFVATYRVHHYTFYPSGTIVYAQIPSPPGTKAVTNSEGYTATGRYAYVFRGVGRIVQWIQFGTNVSACMRLPAPYFTALKCDEPSPFIPSNGFGEEGVGLIQSQVQSWDYVTPESTKGGSLGTQPSSAFGSLQCLTLPQLSTRTCVDNRGIVVSWTCWNGAKITENVSLIALNYHPTARDFRTLIKPTSKFFLPPQ